jgi:fumarate hydratase class I
MNTSTIRQADLIESVAAALQFISYYHPADYIAHLARAYEREQSPAAKDAIAQILTNSRMSAEGHRPICQDTGIVNVFLKIGMDVRFEGFSGTLEDAINEGVRQGYNHPDNTLRASIVADPQFERKNTKDNTPAVMQVEMVRATSSTSRWQPRAAARRTSPSWSCSTLRLGGRLGAQDRAHHGRRLVPARHAGHRHRRHGRERAVLLAKQALMEDIDMYELLQRGPRNKLEELRIELYEKVNALGIGAQGLGGLTTVLDVKINMFPTHAAGKPVAMIPNCAATRHAHFVMDGRARCTWRRRRSSLWPDVHWAPDYQKSRKVDLDTLTPAEIASWKAGDTLLLSGKMLTGRDAAHKRIQDMLAKGESLPVDFTNRTIYYVGPVDPVRDEAVGPAGPPPPPAWTSSPR